LLGGRRWTDGLEPGATGPGCSGSPRSWLFPWPPAAAPLATPAAKAATTTAGQLADQGRTVYANSCAGCHGAQGEGGRAPALIGQNVRFPRFDTAQDLLEYITQRMPANHPGTLTAEQYLQATAYILVENGFVQRDASLGRDLMGGIQLTR
jgi:polar amino acid transport system substrate-binding protein